MAHKKNDRIKVSGYAQRVFFNNGIEYRDFSDDLVGNQITSEGGVPLFTMGNFTITTNLDPKPDRVFKQGTFSEFCTLDDISEEDPSVLTIESNLKTQLNLDLTNPLNYVWYGSFVEFNRVSLEDISDRWPAAIYVDNKVGSVTGDSVTNYYYNPVEDESVFTVNSKYFFNPFKIKYSTDEALVVEEEEVTNLRNLIINHTSYVIEFNNRSYDIIEFTGSTQVTNANITIKTKGNAFVNLTDINGATEETEGSFQYFIKPKESKIEDFFSSFNDYQRNLLNRQTYPIYKTTFSYPEDTVEGVIIYKEQTINFPLTKDGYNLNFFDGLYVSYLDRLNEIAELFDKKQTHLMVRKYTADIINSFDTAPRCDGDDFTNNGQKATHLLNIYGREYDEIKKYSTGIKYAHVVTYNKRDNVPDSLTKDLVHMLGFEREDLLSNFNLKNILLPSDGVEGFSGQSRDYTKKEIETEVYRRVILNIAWLWKSKGTRKAVEFLFRLMGAPESTVVFDEHLYVADSPVDLNAIKRLLYLYTGEADISNLPFDEDGYPLPPLNGEERILSYYDEEGNIQFTEPQEMYFQKGGGWYRETGGDDAHIHTSVGNNPHAGPYDGGREYIAQFESNCFIPGFKNVTEYTTTANTLNENLFINYNHGFFNGMPNNFDLYAVALEGNNNQILNPCFDLEGSVEVCPPLPAGTSVFQQMCVEALEEYQEWVGLLEKNPHLVYSPEWYTVKRNYEVANKKFAQELISENCNVNQCLAICVKKKDIFTPTCESYNVVNADPFIYFTDSNGKKVLFDDFPSCCVAEGGVYKTFTNPTGREACYCAKSAPCASKPVGMRDNGIILFELGDGINVVNTDIIQISKGDVSYCFEKIGVIDEGIEALLPNINEYLTPKDVAEYNTESPQNAVANDVEGIDAAYAFSKKDGLDKLKAVQSGYSVSNTKLKLLDALYNTNLFKSVPCHLASTTIVSSPECCVWYNYSYTIVEQDDKKVIACYDPYAGTGVQATDEVIVNLKNELEEKIKLKKELESRVSKGGGEKAVAAASEAVRKKA
jgi:hypothetical protein